MMCRESSAYRLLGWRAPQTALRHAQQPRRQRLHPNDGPMMFRWGVVVSLAMNRSTHQDRDLAGPKWPTEICDVGLSREDRATVFDQRQHIPLHVTGERPRRREAGPLVEATPT